jgi:hypothetical protein
MDAVSNVALVPEQPRTGSDGSSPVTPADRALVVTAIYCLSEQGRKLSLLSGGDGRAMQQLTVHVPSTRLHLATVDADGVARLRLRPHYEYDANQQVVRIDAPPTYDAPPDLDTLFQQAARNHQLERTYDTQRRAERTKRHNADRDRRSELARAFLKDPERRAVVHPAPTPTRCYLAVNGSLVRFDTRNDDRSTRDVPPEANRRFRSDLRARAERGRQQHAAQVALHEEKKRFIADWIAAHGSPDQRARQAAGMLPMDEVIEAITDDVFTPLAEWPRYKRGGAAQYQAFLRPLPEYADVVLTGRDLLITSADAVKASSTQWARMQEAQTRLPDGRVTLRVHRLAHARDHDAPTLTLNGLLLTQKLGPFILRREYQVDS